MGFAVVIPVFVIFRPDVGNTLVGKHVIQFLIGHLARMSSQRFVGKGNVLFVHRLGFHESGSF